LPNIHADFISLAELLVVILDKSWFGILSSAAAASVSFLPPFCLLIWALALDLIQRHGNEIILPVFGQ